MPVALWTDTDTGARANWQSHLRPHGAWHLHAAQDQILGPRIGWRRPAVGVRGVSRPTPTSPS